jgi:formylglycine-generating enzyme required for sulfatase activity
VGDAGSGKTTTLHYGALVLAHDYAQHTTAGARDTLDLHCPQPLLPFYIRLTLVATYVREAEARATSDELPALQGAPSKLLLEWLDSYTVAQVKNSQRAIPDHMPSKRLEDGACLVMLDGLDETGDEYERAYIQRLIHNLQQDYPHNRYLVASRPFADLRLPAFEERHLSPMNGDEMQTLLRKWFGAMQEASTTHKQRERSADQVAYLWGILQRNPRLFEMATNPLLLTSMALLVYTGTGLPRERAKLYYNLVDLLLEQWRIEQVTGGKPGKRDRRPLLFAEEETIESVRRRLQKLAAWMQEQQRREIRLREVQEQLRADYAEFMGWHREKSDDYVCRLMESLSLESGLVQRRDNGYSFAHYTLQEYLTARAYDEREQGVDGLFDHYHQPRWRETTLLAVGHWATSGYPDRARQLLRRLLDTSKTDALLLAAAALDDADADRVLELSPLRSETIQRLHSIAFSPDACPNPTTRNEAAELLDRLGGDNRPALNFTREEYWAARIEPGEFILGDDHSEYGNEKPAMRYRILRPYALARFPVTNRQYLAFLEDLERQGRTDEANQHRPIFWPGKHYRAGEGNHPVVGVTWYNVTAFATWLDRHLKDKKVIPESDIIRLPTEPEWERAAAYPVAIHNLEADKRLYPWPNSSNEQRATHRANTKESDLSGTSVVGIFPHGSADCGAQDLAGNVWEWCATPYMGYNKYPTADKLPVDRTAEQDRGRSHVLRGGAWYFEQMFSRCVSRGDDHLVIHGFNGVRVARLFS